MTEPQQTRSRVTDGTGGGKAPPDPFRTGADPDRATFGRAVLFKPGYGQEPAKWVWRRGTGPKASFACQEIFGSVPNLWSCRGSIVLATDMKCAPS